MVTTTSSDRISTRPPGTLVLSSPLYSHVVSNQVSSLVCDHCLSRPDLLDNKGPPATLSRCSRCKISYYCGPPCQREAWAEHKEECRYLKKVAPRVPPAIVRLLLRTLTRSKKDGDVGEEMPGGQVRRLKDLMMHKEEVLADRDKKEAFSSFLQVAQACVGAETYSAGEMLDTYCRILINSTEITDMMGNSIGTGLSLALSSVNHSCVPNCCVVFKGKTVELRTMQKLPQPLTASCRIDYLHTVLPRQMRQQRLQEDYFFTCDCSLCSDNEGDQLTAGALLCRGCQGAVPVAKGYCQNCKIDMGNEEQEKAMLFFENGEEHNAVQMYNNLKDTFHIMDHRMVELAEKTMSVCLNLGNFKKYLEIGESLLSAYRAYFSPLSPSLGLHLAKVAKTAIYLDQTDKADQYLKEALKILRSCHGSESELCQYLLSLKETY